MLAAAALLCVAARGAQAHDFQYAYRPHHGYQGYHGPVVRWPVAMAPRVVVPVRVAPRVVYRPDYGYYPYCAPRPYYYGPSPYYGFYYQSRGLSIGVGF
jgi:hypothetical protein